MITLDMAQPLEAQIRNRVRELHQELRENLEVTYRRDEEPKMPERTVEMILADLDATEADLRNLRQLRDSANLTAKVSWKAEGQEELTIQQALELVKSIRERVHLFKEMGSKNPHPQSNIRQVLLSRGQAVADELIKPTYDVKKYKELGQKLERQANALSLAIDKANQRTEIPFDTSKYLEGLE